MIKSISILLSTFIASSVLANSTCNFTESEKKQINGIISQYPSSRELNSFPIYQNEFILDLNRSYVSTNDILKKYNLTCKEFKSEVIHKVPTAVQIHNLQAEMSPDFEVSTDPGLSLVIYNACKIDSHAKKAMEELLMHDVNFAKALDNIADPKFSKELKQLKTTIGSVVKSNDLVLGFRADLAYDSFLLSISANIKDVSDCKNIPIILKTSKDKIRKIHDLMVTDFQGQNQKISNYITKEDQAPGTDFSIGLSAQ